MKCFLTCIMIIMSFSAKAVPKSLYIASPKTIEVVNRNLILTFELRCKNQFPDEWAGNLITVSNDEGDMAVAVGVVLSKQSCVAGPKKSFKFKYALKSTGITPQDILNGVTFKPANVFKQ